MKKTLLMLISLILCMSFVLASCDKGASDDELFGTQGGEKTQKKTEATTAPQEPVEIPTNLQPVILNENQIVSRLTEGKGVTVDIYNGETIELTYHGWPTVCKGEDGTLYASASLRISHVDPFGAVVFYESHDNGETWSDPVIVADTTLDDRDSGIVYLGNGKILVNWFCHDAALYLEHEEYTAWQKLVSNKQKLAVEHRWEKEDPISLKGGSFVALSEDGGKTWGEPIRVPVKSPHGMTLGQDGRTLYFFGVPSSNSGLAGVTGLQGGYAYLFTSRDYGKTWSQRSKVQLPTNLGKDTFYDECYAIQLKDGSFVGCIRTEKSYLERWTICVTTSKDGSTWEKPVVLQGVNDDEPVNGAPPHLLQLSNGAILLAYSCRQWYGDNPKSGSRGRISYDGGKTWGDEFIICVSDQPKNSDLGYPSTVELADGTLITTYYQAFGQDKNPSLLYTKWRLEEVE